MIVKIKSTKQVAVSLIDPTQTAFIFCELDLQNWDGENYRVNGNYYYIVESGEEPIYTTVIIRNVSSIFTNEEINTLYKALDIVYPKDATYIECRTIDLTKGLIYIVTIEPIFGLSGNDWEIV
jgi:hypothetical protein